MKTVIKFILIAFVVAFQSIQFVSAEEPVKSVATYKYTVYGEIPVVESSFEEEHFLGAAISPKWNTFQQNYIHEYSVEVGFSDSGTEIIKPSVFNAVERANKYVKKSLKKGLMTKEEAVKVMAHILDCANVICFENETQSFESAAKEAKSGEQVVELFQQVELVVI